jgi:hypothetical protein
MQNLLCGRFDQREPQQESFKKALKELGEKVNQKREELKRGNEAMPRPLEKYPVFDRPELIRKPGTEVTQLARENFDRLIQEADKYCALPMDQETGRRIPKAQIEDLRQMVFTNRIFIQSGIDHQRARIEFDVTKNDLVEKWEKKYGVQWARYKKDVLLREDMDESSRERLMAGKGKKVSRHHFLPVRAILIKEGSGLEKMLETGQLNPSSPQLSKHYTPNESQNLIPSIYPKDHLGGLHHSDSIFSSIFGPIKMDYQYTQIDPKDPNRFTYAVPKEYHHLDVPSFAKDYGYFLEKMEERMGYSFPMTQKENAVGFITDFVRTYPFARKVVKTKNGPKIVIEKKLEELPYDKILENVQNIKRYVKNGLKSEWEKNTGLKWPKETRTEFLIPPFYKPKRYEWWMVSPAKKPLENEGHHPIEVLERTFGGLKIKG